MAQTSGRSGATSQQGSGFVWTPANVVTVVRIACIPVLVLLMLMEWGTPNVRGFVSLVVFALISLTDTLDGYLARSRNEVTTFGKFMDPIADKLLVMAAMLALVQLGSLPAWVPLVIVSREFLVSGLRMVAASAGVVIAASGIGKAKTLTTMVAICLFIIKDTPALSSIQGVWEPLSWALMIIAVVLTIWSMVDYFAKAWPLLTEDTGGASAAQAEAHSGAPALEASKYANTHVPTPHELSVQAADVINQARTSRTRLGTAESLTGGLISATLTSVPGSSDVVAGGVASYMASVKQSVLGVPGRTIEERGVVSSQTACAMARGALSTLGVDVAVSVTGVAGPGGGTPETPVGTVWFGLAVRGGDVTSEKRRFDGDREQVRTQTVAHALELLSRGIAQRAE
ncbi:MAG: CDP-diacylglycerol--glycerol-3-phosphate 3-phosphatidyltransferase [Coriobacteriia bacterium]|nr:CDP-diacylglycerol--glycerol-3-phosphate 3-phosphatidyltransferase [Coriobacteriia bacterium]MBS5478299.1 CDP-diacylglycerol--glycerol-3-phosphate 3-phosphatidyltransferase [Coriobacteriia bacterium]